MLITDITYFVGVVFVVTEILVDIGITLFTFPSIQTGSDELPSMSVCNTDNLMTPVTHVLSFGSVAPTYEGSLIPLK